MKFRDLLRRYIERRRYKVAYVAQKLGVTAGYFYNVEAGRRAVIGADLIRKLIDVLALNRREAFDFVKTALRERSDNEDFIRLLEELSDQDGRERTVKFLSQGQAEERVKKVLETYYDELQPDVLAFVQKLNRIPAPDRMKKIQAFEQLL